MPKIFIPKENFYETDIFTRKQNLRYRIISDNLNNFSYWSPIFSIDPAFSFIPSDNFLVQNSSNQTLVVWDAAQIEKNSASIGELLEYDVWIRWGNVPAEGTWEYYQRVSGTSINILKPFATLSVNYVSVEIYSPMRPRDYRIDLYEIDQSNSAGQIDLKEDTILLPISNTVQTGDALRYSSSNPILYLTSNTTYYARKVPSTNKITLHPTKSDAINNTNIVDLESHTNAIGYFKSEESLVYDFLLYSEYNVPSA